MSALLRVEIARWVRTRRLIVVLVAAVFVGVSAPLSVYFLPEILAASAGADALVLDLPEPGVVELLAAYFSSASQLLLLAYCYLASLSCALGSDPSLRLFYLSRASSRWRILAPRLLAVCFFLSISTALAAACTAYELWALLGVGLDSTALIALLIQSGGMLLFALASALITVLSRSVFLPVLAVFGVGLVGGLFSGLKDMTWAPTALLQPDLALLREVGLGAYNFAFLNIFALLLLLSIAVSVKPLRR